MKATYIDYRDTQSFSETLLRYLSRDPKLESFISYWPEKENFGKLISDRKSPVDRNPLVDALREQYSDVRFDREESALVFQNIESLSDPDTYTITTGHQLNIFTGPLYFIYKIVTAINLAKELKAEFPEKNFVPVYWMATEDHDFAEINHTKIQGENFSWELDAKGATGRINTASIVKALKSYEGVLGITEHSEKLKNILEEAYLKHDTLAEATRFLVHSLFAKFGLLVLDADDRKLKKLYAPIIKQDLQARISHQTITATSDLLNSSGFDTQVHAREINFFYLQEGLRERIVFEDQKWLVLNTDISFTRDELIEEVDNHPERFSPNVVMRPLYQELILPNLAYIGGGAEIVYWLQLKGLFEAYGHSFPILVPRNSALICGKSFTEKLKRIKVEAQDIFKPVDVLKKEWVLANSKHQLNLSFEESLFAEIFEKIKTRAAGIDPTLAPSTEAVQARLRNALSNLEQKLIKAEKKNHEGALTQIDSLKRKYFPGNSLQERTENFGLLYASMGDEFISELVRHFKPLEFKFSILEQ